MEVAHYFRRFPKDEFTKRMPEILNLSTTGIMNLTIEIMEESLSLVLQYSNFWPDARDCVIIATMKAAGTNLLISHDAAFSRVKDIKVIDEIP